MKKETREKGRREKTDGGGQSDYAAEMAALEKAKAEKVPIFNYRTEIMYVLLEGVSPVMFNCFGHVAKESILGWGQGGDGPDKKKGQAKQPRAPRDPEKSFRESMYLIELNKKNFIKSKFGIPAIWFKKAMIEMAKDVKLGTLISRNVQVGATFACEERLPLDCQTPPHVQLGADGTPGVRVLVGKGMNKTPDIRYRGMVDEWRVVVPIKFRASVIGRSDILTLLSEAGEWNGCGEWRVQKNGVLGKWRIVSVDNKKVQ